MVEMALSEGAYGVMAIVVGNESSDTRSNPWQGWFQLTWNYYHWERYESNHSPFSYGVNSKMYEKQFLKAPDWVTRNFSRW